VGGLDRPIALVGFMGAGKSLVGKELAEALGRPYADLDEEVARRVGMTVPELFEREGESAFRRREVAALVALMRERPDVVISCGGGIVTTSKGRKALSRAIVVYMAVSEERVAKRLEGVSGRPLLEGYEGDARRARIHELLAARRPLYAEVADLAVDGGRPAGEVTRRIQRELEAYGRDGDTGQTDEG
jgi:shikimate kinase